MLGSGDREKQALVYADVTNPQSMNKYPYTFNNPLRYVDPDGQAPQDSFDNKINQLIRQQLKGEITEKQYWEKLRGAAVGTAAGLAAVAIAIAGREVGAAVLMWSARNPDKVQQIATALQETGGGPPGSITGSSMMSKAELSMAKFLKAEGKNVEKLAVSTVPGVKTADFSINGVITEVKTLGENATMSTLKNRIAEGVGQGGGNVLVDARSAAGVTLADAQRAASRVFGADSRFNAVRVIGRDFDVTILGNPN